MQAVWLCCFAFVSTFAASTEETTYELVIPGVAVGSPQASLLLDKNYGTTPYSVMADIQTNSTCVIEMCVSRLYTAVTNMGLLATKNGCIPVSDSGTKLTSGVHTLSSFGINNFGFFYLNVVLSQGCSGRIVVQGNECSDSLSLGSECQSFGDFALFEEGTVVVPGEELTFVYVIPETGAFGDISLSITTTGTASSKGTLALSMDGSFQDGFGGKITTFVGNSSGSVSYIARRGHVYVFSVSNIGADAFTLTTVNFHLQNCNDKDHEDEPACSWTVPIHLLKDGEGTGVFNPSSPESWCKDGWCYIYLMDDGCSPVMSFRTNGTYPDVYFKSESIATQNDFDIFFPTNANITYNPEYSHETTRMNVIGFHFYDLTEFRVLYKCESPHGGVTPTQVVGLLLLGLIMITVVASIAYYLHKKKTGYEVVG